MLRNACLLVQVVSFLTLTVFVNHVNLLARPAQWMGVIRVMSFNPLYFHTLVSINVLRALTQGNPIIRARFAKVLARLVQAELNV
jgi:hypothetical protein